MPSSEPRLVLGLSSSPRKGANTDTVVTEILAGAAEVGAKTEFIRLADLEIAPCNACYWCKDNSGCCIDDDMQRIYRSLLEANRWVIGTPVYFYTANAVLKATIERIFAWYMDPAGRPTKGMGKKCAVVTLCADDNVEEQGAPVFEIFEKGLPDYDVEFTARVALQGVALDKVAPHWSNFAPARELGRELSL
jgi:multimeric flavodoxin WrbA